MISASWLGSASLPAPRVKPGFRFFPEFNPFKQKFAPPERYADVGSQKIISTHPGIRLHTGSTSTLHLEKGTLLGMDITYITQVWNLWDVKSITDFYDQIFTYVHCEPLRPLMGVCVPTAINFYDAGSGRVAVAMELPHPVGWRQADPYISVELKEKVVIAYQNLHSKVLLHNDVKVENILIGDDDKVTIVDFGKMVVYPRPADFFLEMRAVKFIIDYHDAKRIEYERTRRAVARVERNLWRSKLRQAAKSQELADEVEPDEPPSQEEIECPPFSIQSLMAWDSEVISEGTNHCQGWRGMCFEVPQDMRTPPWPGIKDCAPPSLVYRPTDFAFLVKTAFGQNPFVSHSQWMKRCRYLKHLWSPLPESAGSDPDHPAPPSMPSLGTTYFDDSEEDSASTSESSKRDCSPAPLSPRKRSRAEEPARPDDPSYGSKRARGSKASETFGEYEGDLTSWTTCPEEPGPPSSISMSKEKERERPSPTASLRETSASGTDPAIFADLSADPQELAGTTTRSIAMSSPARSISSNSRTRTAASPRKRPKSERRCAVIVKDSNEEDKVWLMSEGALQDVKGYLQVKKAAGAAIEIHQGGEEGGVRRSHLRVEKLLRSSSTGPSRKRTSGPERNSAGAQKSKRRQSWPEYGSYASEPSTASLPSSG